MTIGATIEIATTTGATIEIATTTTVTGALNSSSANRAIVRNGSVVRATPRSVSVCSNSNDASRTCDIGNDISNNCDAISCACNSGVKVDYGPYKLSLSTRQRTTRRTSTVRRCCDARSTTVIAKAFRPDRPTGRTVGASILKKHTAIRTRAMVTTVTTSTLNEYQYYFREGFRRGYEDGYHSRSQYGRYSNGG